MSIKPALHAPMPVIWAFPRTNTLLERKWLHTSRQRYFTSMNILPPTPSVGMARYTIRCGFAPRAVSPTPHSFLCAGRLLGQISPQITWLPLPIISSQHQHLRLLFVTDFGMKSRRSPISGSSRRPVRKAWSRSGMKASSAPEQST